MRSAVPGLRAVTIDLRAWQDRVLGLRRAGPLGHFTFPAALFLGILLLQLGVRIAYAGATTELRTHVARTHDAVTARERLRLDLSVRAGDPSLRAVAQAYGLGAPAVVATIPEPVVAAP